MPFRRSCTVSLAVLALALTPPAHAQVPVATARPSVPVRGIAFDSVRGKPIRNAFVAIMGGIPGTTTDTNGRFTFDSVPPGIYTFAMQHAMLDSLGFSGLTARATISAEGDEVRIAVPSFATLWRAACHAGTPPSDSGFIYGNVRSGATRKVVANATIRLMWSEMLLSKNESFRLRNWHLDARSDSLGNYAICGVPVDGGSLRVQATSEFGVTGEIDLPPGEMRVFRRDLTLGAPPGTDSSQRGTIAGILTDNLGDPYFNARVVSAGLPEARTGADGRFVMRDVPAGTRQIEFRSVGMIPIQSVVDIVANDTATVIMQLGRMTTLEGVRVERERRGKALAADFQVRRKLGMGYSMDTTDVLKFANFSSVFANIPSLRAEYRGPNMLLAMSNGRGGFCRPTVRLDGVIASFANLSDLSPHEVAGVEVFPRAAQIPAGYSLPASEPECGMILVWTRYGFRER